MPAHTCTGVCLHSSSTNHRCCTPAVHPLLLSCSFSTPTRTKTYTGKVAGLTVHLAHNGTCDKFDVDKVGTNAATLTTYLAIAAFRPDLVISSGTAGGFKAHGAQIASVFVSTATQNHDRRVPLPGFDKSGVGLDHSHPAERMAKELGAPLALAATVEPFSQAVTDQLPFSAKYFRNVCIAM